MSLMRIYTAKSQKHHVFWCYRNTIIKKNLGRNIGYIQKERIESLIYNIENHIIINKIQQWKNNGASNILEPCLLLGKHRFPHTDWSMLTFQLMLMVEQIDQELNRTITPLEQIKVINHIIYNINNINGNISTLKIRTSTISTHYSKHA